MKQNIFLSCRESICNIWIKFISVIARVAELVDAPDLGSGAVRREGSTPSSGTKKILEGVAKRPLPDSENESRCGKDNQSELKNTAEV
jgi:hypothetical protein